MTDTPQTLLEAVRYYSDPKVCFETMLMVKWPDGQITCPKCGGESVGVIRSRSLYSCRECRTQFSARLGTIFEDSPVSVCKWFVAAWCVANGDAISSPKLAEVIGVTQKTAWSMLNRIRVARQLTHKRVKLRTRRIR